MGTITRSASGGSREAGLERQRPAGRVPLRRVAPRAAAPPLSNKRRLYGTRDGKQHPSILAVPPPCPELHWPPVTGAPEPSFMFPSCKFHPGAPSPVPTGG